MLLNLARTLRKAIFCMCPYVAVVLNPVSTCEQTQGTWQGAVKCRLPSNRTASLDLIILRREAQKMLAGSADFEEPKLQNRCRLNSACAFKKET